MLIGFHFGISATDQATMSVIRRRLGRRREHVGPAGQVLLDDVVLRGAGQRGARRALLVGHRDVQREQPHGRRVDRHRGVGLGQRDAVEQRAHVPDVADRHADPADLAPGQLVVGVVAGLGGQVEGHREPGLALGQVAPVQRVGRRGRGVPGVGAHHPGPVTLTVGRVRHRTPPPSGPRSYVRSRRRRSGEGRASHPKQQRDRSRQAEPPAAADNGPMADQATRLFVLFGGLLLMLRVDAGPALDVRHGATSTGAARPGPGRPDRRRPARRRSPGCRPRPRPRCCGPGSAGPASGPPSAAPTAATGCSSSPTTWSPAKLVLSDSSDS